MSAAVEHAAHVATSRGYWLLALTAAVLLGPQMWPVQWSGNEINYFDLNFRFVHPEAFTDHHAIFDGSNARVVSYLLIGGVIDVFGFELAKTILALTLWPLSALVLAAVAREINLRVVDLAVALSIFLLRQGILGNEWMFATVEAKVIAYIAVFSAISAGLAGRWSWVIAATTLATYMHFLVGGFWAIALIAMHQLKSGRWAFSARLGAAYSMLVLPILVILFRERVGVQVDTSGLDRSLNAIYTEFSAHFHVAPLLDGWRGFIRDWLPGLCAHLALVVALFVLRSRIADRALGTWLIGLNIYVLIALVIYMLDNGRYWFAPFYLLRPAGLTYLLSLMAVAGALLSTLDSGRPARAALACTVAVALMVLPVALNRLVLIATRFPPAHRLEAALSPNQRDVLDWVRARTAPDDAILIEPIGRGSILEGDAFPGGMERLTGRGFIANFKYIPTHKTDLVRWYRRIRARRDFFQGDCSANDTLGADYVVLRTFDGAGKAEACIESIASNREFVFGRVRKSGAADGS